MFTGIIEEMGQALKVRREGSNFSLEIKVFRVGGDLNIGDSLSVNGVCLTVTSWKGADRVEAEIMPETLRRTNLGELNPGDEVNLERAMTPASRMGGHFVTGHIDGTGSLVDKREEANAVLMRFTCPQEVERYLVTKGSIAVDGISLTVTNTGGGIFEVSLVPHTLASTTLGKKKYGGTVNLEGDLIGKYVEKFIQERSVSVDTDKPKSITSELLQEKGFW